MKKLIAALAGLVLLSSIIIVSFFGTLAYTKEKNIYCDYVTLDMKNIMNDDNVAVEVLKRGEGGDDYWYGNDYDYRINVRDTNYILNNKSGEFKLYCQMHTLRPGKLVSDEFTLNYYVSEPVNWNDFLYSNNEEEEKIENKQLLKDTIKIKNKEKYETEEEKTFPFTIKVQSSDPKGKFIKIRLQIMGVKK